MPWKESDTVSERIKFVARLLDGERMSDLCREFEISRKTGYKIYKRYESDGLLGLQDKSRAAIRRPNETSPEVICKIIELRKIHKTWGAPKIKAYLEKKFDVKMPATSTVHSILFRHQMVATKKRRSIYQSKGTLRSTPKSPNELWCADFKGQFKLASKQYCYPLTISDRYSRYVLRCEAMESTKEEEAIPIFREAFKEYGLPSAILSDNGVPFGANSKFGLSLLSIYCLRQHIELQRIEPGHPEQNGSHERMHRTLKAEATRNPKRNLLSQQEVFDDWMYIFNQERPHQAIEMKTPNELYKPSKRAFSEILEDLDYPKHQMRFRVSACGSITKSGLFRVYIGLPFKGQIVGVDPIEEGLWKVSFMHYDLGFFDDETQKLQVAVNPFLAEGGIKS